MTDENLKTEEVEDSVLKKTGHAMIKLAKDIAKTYHGINPECQGERIDFVWNVMTNTLGNAFFNFIDEDKASYEDYESVAKKAVQGVTEWFEHALTTMKERLANRESEKNDE